MKIKRINFDQTTCVILGAGASRGASFVKDLPGTLPPLDTDFFTQAQRLSNHKPKNLIESLIKDTVSIFGNDFNLTMEKYFTQIEHLSNVFEDYKLQGRPADNPFRAVRSGFLQILAAVIDESLGREPNCKFHECLVKSLSDGDSILSFNYDYLMDHHLKKFGQAKWNPREGYGVPAYVQTKKGRGTEYWAYKNEATGKIEYPAKSLKLSKMHGSINWFPVSSEKSMPRLQQLYLIK